MKLLFLNLHRIPEPGKSSAAEAVFKMSICFCRRCSSCSVLPAKYLMQRVLQTRISPTILIQITSNFQKNIFQMA